MKNIVSFILGLSILFVTSISHSQTDSSAIVQTIMNYGDGFYSGSPERVESALHTDLNKVSTEVIGENGNTVLYYSTFSGLIEMAKLRIGFLEESKRKIGITIFRISDYAAFAKIMSANFNDYIHLIKSDGKWKIINVLWTYGPDSKIKRAIPDFKGDMEMEPVKEAVTGFFEGMYTGNDALIEKVLHVEYNGIMISKLPESDGLMISKNGFSKMKELARLKLVLTEKEKWNFQVNVLDIMDGLAAAEITTPYGINYMQLAKIDGQWKIINALSKPLIIK